VVSLESGINFKYLLSDDDAQSQHIERQIIRKDGTTIWASENIRVVRDDRGSILYFEGTMEDITQRKEAEEALRQSEERFSKAFHSSPCAKSIIHLPDFRVIDVNRRWQDMTGYSREDVIGRPQEDMNIWTVQQRQRVLEYLNRCSSFNNFDAVFRTKSGEERDTIWSGEIITLGGDTCLLGAAIDITERKKYEREMARLDRLYLVGEMAAGIGHEIRNPMTVVSGYLQLFREKDEFAAYKKRFTIMIEELDRANSIITEFLSLAKNRAVHFNKQSLNNIVAAMLPLIQAEASKHSQSVTLEMNDAPDLLLDGNEIRQIILNLARNGLEAMTANGVLTIRTYLDGKEVILAVHNEGPEIPPEILEKIGAPFFTTKDSGTGLGMAVCYSIASKHNASIRIETRPSGTTFFVCFKSQDDMPAAS
jgi:PAS domain S-box-containing protein